MTLRHFKIYTMVYTERNMTAAAKKLFMAQPSVSQVIKELESHYQVVLFERFPKELKPTPSGDTLFEYATNILEMNAELEDMMKQGSSQHILRVGANDTAGSALLDDLVKEYTSTHPLEKVRVQINRSSILMEMLRANDLDVILTDEFKSAPDLHNEVILEDRFVAVASSNFPNLPAHLIADAPYLSSVRLLLREPGTDERDYFEQYMREHGHTIIPFWESISFDILLNAAKQEMGITILPYRVAKASIEKKELVVLSIPDFPHTQKFVLAWPKNKYLSAPIEEFVKLCRK